MKLSISVVSLLTLGTCSAMLCLLVYFLDHLWMIRILFDVNKYCRFFFYIQISKLLHQWLPGKGKKNQRLDRLHYMFSFVKKWNAWLFYISIFEYHVYSRAYYLYFHKYWMQVFGFLQTFCNPSNVSVEM